MRRSIYLLLALVLALAVILPVTAEHVVLDQQGSKGSVSQQGVESAWIVWETDNPVQRLGIDGDEIWVGTYGGGLGRWDRMHGFQESFTSGDGLPGSDVTGIAHDGSGNLWVTLLDGSVARSSDGASFSNITPPAPADRNAWTVAARGSNIWVGTLGGGVAHRAGSWTLHTQSDGLPFDDIYAVGLESDGTPWVGTMGYGISAYQGGSWVAYDPPLEIANPLSPAENVPNRAITDIVVDGAGVKWFATDGSGVAALDASNTNWTVYSNANSGLCGDFVQAVYLDPADNLWFGTLGRGVCRLNADRSSWTTYDSNSTPLPEDDILDVALDIQGGLWLAAYDVGLAYFGALPDPAPSFDIDPRGVPTLDGTGGHGYWLWLDPVTFEWTLAWSGGIGSYEFDGSIHAPGGFSLVGTQGLEAGDQVEMSGESLVIEASEGDGWDQVTFRLDPGVEELTVALRIDGAFYPYRIHLGGSEDLPGTAPFRITAPQPQPPVVEAGEDIAINEGSYAFLSGNYQDPDSPGGHTLLWDFGDDSPVGESLSTTHLYVDDGVYTATFTVTDVHGLVDEDSLTVTVENVLPEVDFFHEPYSPSVGQTVAFEAILFDAGVEDTHMLSWDFDDDTLLEGPEFRVEHVYGEADEYVVTLTAMDDDGGIGKVSYTITVLPNEPPILMMPDSLALDEGEALSDAVSFTDPDSSAWSVQVDYGNGISDPIINLDEVVPFDLAHTYADNGVHIVTVTITDDQGGFAERTLDVTVANVLPVLEPNEIVPVEEGAEGLFKFGAFADPGFDCPNCAPATLEDFTATIDWGDGLMDDSAIVEEIPGSSGVVTTGTVTGAHTYVDDGEYNATVTICDDDLGCTETQINVTILNVPPSVVSGPDASGLEGALIEVTATFSDPGVQDVHIANVDWGDGSQTPGEVAGSIGTVSGTHAYGDNGVYMVGIELCDDDSACGLAELFVTVENVAPTVEIDSGSIVPINEGDTFVLPAITFSDPGVLDTHTANIDWGDGSKVPGAVDDATDSVSASHTYRADGQFQVIVCVQDDDGAEDCSSFDLFVNNLPPIVQPGDDIDVEQEQPFSTDLATFQDPGLDDAHTAEINWGDDLVEPGEVDEAADVVRGSHTYAEPGSYTLNIEVCDNADACAAVALLAQVRAKPTETPTPTPSPSPTPTETPTPTPTAIEGIEAIKDAIEEYIAQERIDPKAKNSMFSKLDAALKSLGKGNDHTAVNQLGAFINYVEAQQGKKISELAAESLIAQAEAVIAQIEAGDGGNPDETPTEAPSPPPTPEETPSPVPTPEETPTPPPESSPEGIEAIKVAILVYIEQTEIDPKAEKSMMSKLDAALKSFDKGKDQTAINQLGAFINYLQAQRGKKISELAAEDLIARAETVIALIEGDQPS